MSERLLSVGLDVGTTSTQLVVSRLLIENRASSFAVPELEIAQREILYKSPVYLTPLLDESHMDGAGIRRIVEEEYRSAGLNREQVDTGAVIITGETSRKENARAVLDALTGLAGDFVVAAAGPDLESVLAAKGAGAVEYSARTGKTVLHMDIGGGTSNLALVRDGRIVRTGCLNVGGRLVKLDKKNLVTYVSPVLRGIFPVEVGETASEEVLRGLACLLTRALEMAAGLREPDDLLETLSTREAERRWAPPQEPVVVSFSGGVADCIRQDFPPLAFGDIGPVLGRCIWESLLCRGAYVLGEETIRATVIGAGCHSAQLSGSTVYFRNIRFPLKNVAVKTVTVGENLPVMGENGEMYALKGLQTPSYREITDLAGRIAERARGPVLLCLEQDMAKALGQALALRLPGEIPILCIDRVKVEEGSYLDIGSPVSHALPVVVKTLVLGGSSQTFSENEGGLHE